MLFKTRKDLLLLSMVSGFSLWCFGSIDSGTIMSLKHYGKEHAEEQNSTLCGFQEGEMKTAKNQGQAKILFIVTLLHRSYFSQVGSSSQHFPIMPPS